MIVIFETNVIIFWIVVVENSNNVFLKHEWNSKMIVLKCNRRFDVLYFKFLNFDVLNRTTYVF